MFINIILLVIFLGSLFAVWYKISQRIPRLIAVSDEAIASYLKEESSKLHFFAVEIKSFYKDKRYKEWLRDVWAKLLYRFHILLLRVDNKITTVLKDLRVSNTKVVESRTENITEIRPEEKAVPSKISRIQEVRIRRRTKQKDIQNLTE